MKKIIAWFRARLTRTRKTALLGVVMPPEEGWPGESLDED
jgi:hypothetical protein